MVYHRKLQWPVASCICPSQGLWLLFPELLLEESSIPIYSNNCLRAVLHNFLTQQLLNLFIAWFLNKISAALEAKKTYLYMWLIQRPTMSAPFARSGALLVKLRTGTDLLLWRMHCTYRGFQNNFKDSSFAFL